MWQYIFKRLLLILPTLIGIITICFIFTQIVPGGPVDQMIAEIQSHKPGGSVTGGGSSEVSSGSGNTKMEAGKIEKEQIDYLKKLYGFDQPIYIQYFRWLKRLFTFDFGSSYFYNKKITTLIKEKLPVSASLGIF